jgi:hypothetical protein
VARPAFVTVFAILLLPYCSSAQSQPPSDPQAVAYASQSIAALTGGTSISDITLTGNVTWTGSAASESGTATLLALGTSESKMTLALPDGTRTEIRDSSTGTAQGQWISESGASGLFAPQNTMTDAVWFYPALGSLAAGPNVVLSYVGLETRNGESVQHIQSYIFQSAPSGGGGPTAQQLSTIDFYLDATTLLPSATVFDAHPDNNASSNIVIEVDFSNYQTISGVNVPMHIQKSSQGSILIDLTVTGASFNSGLPLSDFSIN